MILSYSNNFLFIKTPKTGGTSLEVCLSKYCNTNDILTPIHKNYPINENENLRRKISNLSAQNYIAWKKSFKILNFYNIKKYSYNSIFDRITKNYFYNHMSLCDVKKKSNLLLLKHYLNLLLYVIHLINSYRIIFGQHN